MCPPVSSATCQIWFGGMLRNTRARGFKTAPSLPFTYDVEESGIGFFHNGKRINRELTRAQLDIALARCPLTSTTEIRDLMDIRSRERIRNVMPAGGVPAVNSLHRRAGDPSVTMTVECATAGRIENNLRYLRKKM